MVMMNLTENDSCVSYFRRLAPNKSCKICDYHNSLKQNLHLLYFHQGRIVPIGKALHNVPNAFVSNFIVGQTSQKHKTLTKEQRIISESTCLKPNYGTHYSICRDLLCRSISEIKYAPLGPIPFCLRLHDVSIKGNANK